MMENWTPGPWVVVECDDGDARYSIEEAGGIQYTLASIISDVPTLKECADANAHLIAAAPDLFTALERTLSWLTSYPGGGALPVYEQARAALAKARSLPSPSDGGR